MRCIADRRARTDRNPVQVLRFYGGRSTGIADSGLNDAASRCATANTIARDYHRRTAAHEYIRADAGHGAGTCTPSAAPGLWLRLRLPWTDSRTTCPLRCTGSRAVYPAASR